MTNVPQEIINGKWSNPEDSKTADYLATHREGYWGIYAEDYIDDYTHQKIGPLVQQYTEKLQSSAQNVSYKGFRGLLTTYLQWSIKLKHTFKRVKKKSKNPVPSWAFSVLGDSLHHTTLSNKHKKLYESHSCIPGRRSMVEGP